MSKELTEFEMDPYSLFLFAINSPTTKEKCVPRLNKFFEFIHLNGTMQDKCLIFIKNANSQPSWAVGSVIKYLQYNKVAENEKFSRRFTSVYELNKISIESRKSLNKLKEEVLK